MTIEEAKEALERAATNATHQETGLVLQFVALPVALAVIDRLSAVRHESAARYASVEQPREENDHGAALLPVDQRTSVNTETLPIADRIRQYFAWCESPQFVPCPRCKGKGYHHGFGENGADPDWCLDCGGPGEEPTEPGTWSPDDLLREALEELQVGSVSDSQQRSEP